MTSKEDQSMPCRFNIILLAIVLFFQLVTPCVGREQPGKSITLTQKETLAYLVNQSDLIAIVQIIGGTNKRRVFSFADMPKQVDARIVSIIKGVENKKGIKLDSSPRFYPPGVIKSSVVLRNGRHLVFLSRDGVSYKPTTRFSIFDVFNNKVHPIWKQGVNSDEISAGYALEVIVDEIETEMNQQVEEKNKKT